MITTNNEQNNQQPMDFQQFFPIFRDTILGLTFMHINKIAHRDIKPANIVKFNKDNYVLVDFGNGINLQNRD